VSITSLFSRVELMRRYRFTVYPRPRSVRRDQPAYKVKSVLKGTEYDGTCSFGLIRRLTEYASWFSFPRRTSVLASQ
jgi:hypothetical protein